MRRLKMPLHDLLLLVYPLAWKKEDDHSKIVARYRLSEEDLRRIREVCRLGEFRVV